MLLKRIKFNNFRPFKGAQEILLTTTNDKPNANVTIIIGDNTYGKSTFVLSFIWCLYGESLFSRKDDILNKKIENSMNPTDTENATVELEFEDSGKCYTVRRTQLFRKNIAGDLMSDTSQVYMSYVTENGESKQAGKSQNEINKAIGAILPKDLSTFFFFEGEKSNEISKKDLGRSVRTLLGLEAYEKMMSHLYGSLSQSTPYSTSVMGYYNEKQNNESDQKAKDEYNKMVHAQEELKTINKRIEEIEENKKFYKNKIVEINNKLRSAEPSKNLQKRRDDIGNELEQEKSDLKKTQSQFFKLFSSECFPLFIYPQIRMAQERIDHMDISDKGIKGLEADALHELLARGSCLCGTDLKEGTFAYKSVEKYLDYVYPNSLGTSVRDVKERIDSVEESSRRFLDNFEDTYTRIQSSNIRIDKLEQENDDILEEIRKIGNVDTKDAEENLRDYNNKLHALDHELDDKKSEATRKTSAIETASNNFNMYKGKSEKAQEFQLYYKYAESIFNWVKNNYSEKESKLRSKLTQYVTELFNNMYDGKRDIKIDEKYNIIMTVDGSVIDDTGGLRVIQYFAYVGGLVKLAYEVMKSREVDEDGNSQALGEQYPLVLDAAFSHADSSHTLNISRELAESSSQLIFALMQKDWLYAKEGLVGKVGRMYELIKIDEIEVKIVEVK